MMTEWLESCFDFITCIRYMIVHRQRIVRNSRIGSNRFNLLPFNLVRITVPGCFYLFLDNDAKKNRTK